MAVGRDRTKPFFQKMANTEWNGLPRMRDLPAHHQHQAKAEQQEEQRRDTVLNPDDLMVGGKNVVAEEAAFFVVRLVGSRMKTGVGGGLHIFYFNQILRPIY